jgi:hypothetical protein
MAGNEATRPAPGLDFAFEVRVTVAPPLELGQTPIGRRRIIDITGGSVVGPRLSGRILPGGADWLVARPDGTAFVDARYTIEADDGGLIFVHNTGYRHAAAAVLARLAAGEAVAPDDYYFRTTPYFDTAAPAHHWLTHSIFVGNAAREPERVVISFYLVR